MIRFAGQRAVLLDAVAMGLLRKYLVESFGVTARTVLTQFGFAHGWRMAEAVRAEFRWETDDEWRSAGTRIPALEPVSRRYRKLTSYGLIGSARAASSRWSRGSV